MSEITYQTWIGTKGGPELKTVTKPALTGHQVFVKTTHSGLCGTDLHHYHDGLGLGHEGAAVVAAVGPDVTNHKVGDRVAWGWVQGACGECEQCKSGYFAMCESSDPTKKQGYLISDHDQGSMSTGAIWDSRYIFKIPDSISSEEAAPLMCGGWTVWCALQGFDLKATDHVGIVGVGGLGHLAIQFASKMGCEVTVFSRTESKKAEALALGANHFIATENAAEYKVARPINVLLITANSHIDWKLYVPAMSARGTIFPLQIPDDPDWFAPISFPHMPFLIKGLQVIYSTGGRLDAVDKMLAFAALHNVKPTIECFPLNKEGIEKGFEKLQSGKMRYRGVLVAQ